MIFFTPILVIFFFAYVPDDFNRKHFFAKIYFDLVASKTKFFVNIWLFMVIL